MKNNKNKFTLYLELTGIIAFLLLLNHGLWSGTITSTLVLTPNANLATWLLHPFVHVSLYHLLIDGIAFLFLYVTLRAEGWRVTLLGILFSGLGSGLIASLRPDFTALGLCGLSGMAHGMSALTSLHWIEQSKEKSERVIGLVTLVLLISKSAYEIATHRMLFMSWHLGELGTPLAEAHVGGVLGGCVAWLVLVKRRSVAGLFRLCTG